jgi:hypothetical protein
MTMYQLADNNHGPFGDLYETESAAERALDTHVAEWLEEQIEMVRLYEGQRFAAMATPPEPMTDEEAAAQAEAEIRAFVEIVGA